MKNDRPVVAHLMRCYLAPTETFIHNQLSFLRSYRPLVVCHRTRSGINLPTDYGVFSAIAHMKGCAKARADFTYRRLRCLSIDESAIIANAINDAGAKLLHFHYAVDARYFLSVCKKMKLPSLVSIYGYDVSSFPRSYFGMGLTYLKPIFSCIDRFIAMSEDMKKDLVGLGCPPNKIIVHYYGVECRRFACPGRGQRKKRVLNILMCGTLEIKKAQHLVLAALFDAEKRKGAHSDFRVTLVGDGPMRQTLLNMTEQYGWRERVRFCGHIPYGSDALIEEFHDADIFALPSITVKGDKEGIPGTIVEAMAAGLPVVSSFHAGIPEVVDNGVNGILVRENDHNGLVDALAELMENERLRAQIGAAAAEKAVREYDAEKKVRDLERIYQDLIK